jgi:hypothetical protein
MKKQKKLTAILASVLMLVASGTSTVGATYAWFTRGTEATATGFDFTASAASGIQVSTDALTWQSNLTDVDFDTTTPGAPQENNRLSIPSMEPISTVDGSANLTNGEFDFFGTTSIDGNYTIAADTTNYLVFDLYFLNQGSSDLTLTLTDSSTVTDGTNNKEASLATRVGFVVEGNNSDPTTATALAEGNSTYIWEPNSVTHNNTSTSSGIVQSAKYNYYGLENDNSSVAVADDYYQCITDGAWTDPVDTTNDIAIGDSGVITVLPSSSQITKIKIFVWMEGQDVDCKNSASEGDVDIALGFDTGAATTTLTDRTATVISTPAGTSQVTLDQNGTVAATYSVYVLQDGTDANQATLDYRLYLSTGSNTFDTSPIDLGTVVGAGNYEVVVVGESTGSISSRTSAALTHA